VIGWALVYLITHYRQDKQQFRKEESLFIRHDQYNRMIYWITMVAFGGIIAIAYAHPMLLYLMFYWAILALSIRLNSFLREFQLGL
jgi:hypothetical protein